jgi:DNA modification methylase
MTGLNLDTIECADVMDYLRGLPDACVNLVVTSPPYFGLRSYLQDGHEDKAREIGTEQTPAAYVARMVDVFREVKRVIRDDASVYVNLGDSYGSGEIGRNDAVQERTLDGRPLGKQRATNERQQARRTSSLPPKSLMLIPHRFAIAMQDDGWLLREDIVWQKPNPMPESVRDRCTRSHEYIFHFTKGSKYWYDAQAVAEPTSEGTNERGKYPFQKRNSPTTKIANNPMRHDSGDAYTVPASGLRNRRSVWTINPANFKAAHFATFPEDIPEICIKAACPEGGVVLDPFSGAGTTALVAKKLNRRYIGCDLNAEYVKMATDRINGISYTLFSLMEVASD